MPKLLLYPLILVLPIMLYVFGQQAQNKIVLEQLSSPETQPPLQKHLQLVNAALKKSKIRVKGGIRMLHIEDTQAHSTRYFAAKGSNSTLLNSNQDMVSQAKLLLKSKKLRAQVRQGFLTPELANSLPIREFSVALLLNGLEATLETQELKATQQALRTLCDRVAVTFFAPQEDALLELTLFDKCENLHITPLHQEGDSAPLFMLIKAPTYIINGTKQTFPNIIEIKQDNHRAVYGNADYILKETFINKGRYWRRQKRKYRSTKNEIDVYAYAQDHHIPNIPQMAYSEVGPNKIVIAVNRLKGFKDLRDYMGGLTPEDQIRIFKTVTETLVHFESNRIRHRDFTAKNILYNGTQTYLIDFDSATMNKRMPVDAMLALAWKFHTGKKPRRIYPWSSIRKPSSDPEAYGPLFAPLAQEILSGTIKTYKQLNRYLKHNPHYQITT